MRIHWTENAIQDLIAIYDYIFQDSPFYAEKMVDRLTRRSQQIADFPFSGRMVPEYREKNLREVFEGPYRLIYRIKADQADILTVIHGARLLPPEPEEIGS
ncbi:MAG TPA: type II toxin-antitoxin system RelE/ParE family toxin [Thermoanaerobaculia bacterium]|nr:type II toxin-antitoxin system RelE/ParE family toxin [Thermoanaerobaculia bacterium]